MPPRISAAWLVAPCIACDFLMVPAVTTLKGPPNAGDAASAFGIVGCVLAQGCLLAAYLAWGEGGFLRRLVTHWTIAAGLYLVWLVGVFMIVGPDLSTFAATVALGVPLVSVAAQFPLWVVRQWFGWRLLRERFEANRPDDRPLGIRDLMAATLVVAVSLAMARLAVPADGKSVWPIWAASCIVASVVSTIALLPAGALLFRGCFSRRGVPWGIAYAGSLIALEWVCVAAIWWFIPQALAPRALYIGLSSLMLMFAATLMVAAAVARDRGYDLVWGRQQKLQA